MRLPNQAHGISSTARKFSIPLRVYYEDTDAGGVVYHAAYLRFMERARTDFLRALGFEQQRLRAEFSVQFVVTGMTIKYLKPALLDDLVDVTLRINSLGYVRAVFEQTVERVGELLTQASVTVACLQYGGMKPAPIPEALREKMKGS